jgi:hypothetical protein
MEGCKMHMDDVCSSETSVSTFKSTRLYCLEDQHQQNLVPGMLIQIRFKIQDQFHLRHSLREFYVLVYFATSRFILSVRLRMEKNMGFKCSAGKDIPYLRVYKPHFFDKNFPAKIGMRLIHGILCPFYDWVRDAGIVCRETPSRDR